MKRIKIDQWVSDDPWPDEPFVFDARWWDINATMMRAIRCLPDTCVAISLRGGQDYKTLIRCTREAGRKGIRIIWLPSYHEDKILVRANEQD